MHRMKYTSGERTFIVDKTSLYMGWYNIIDSYTKTKFKLPKHVIDTKKYVFSWDRYLEERNNTLYKESVESELNRLKALNSNHANIQKGIKDMQRFLEELSTIDV